MSIVFSTDRLSRHLENYLGGRVQVDERESTLVLRGSVPTLATRSIAEAITRQYAEEARIENQIEVESET